MKYVYLIKNTLTGCIVGAFDSSKKADEVFASLGKKANYIIYKIEINKIYKTNI